MLKLNGYDSEKKKHRDMDTPLSEHHQNRADRLDLLLLGATGFTGTHCISYLLKFCHKYNLTWGVAGRSAEKLKDVLKASGKDIGTDLENITIIVVDINSQDDLLTMARQTKIVLNCTGPFRFLGEPVVKACIASGTHYVDIDAEHQFMEKVQLELDEAAKEKGVYVISGCGFDSIPTDMGIVYVQQEFEGTLNSVVTYLEVCKEDGFKLEPTINYRTLESIVYAMANWHELKDIRRKLFATKTPIFEPKMKWRSWPHKADIVNGWAVPLPLVDRSVAHRTQRHFYNIEEKRPIQTDVYFAVDSFFLFLLIYIALLALRYCVQFKFFRNLLLEHPKILTASFITKDAPSEEKIANTSFQVTFHGKGWKANLPNKDDQYTIPCDSAIVGRVKGNSGYGVTCLALVMSAITVITEGDKIPGRKQRAGVLTPGAAFAKTSLIRNLNENGLTFEIISRKNLN
ncbi:hypothetical protein NQ317_004278 [Molorchus minor]|uniref:Saccharopine dehydrogenase NADP binding domain-containing protein n=1 Tax=Molorchus minor TaxID=1323400 RepID=A0ABQ9JGB7_9CUCU|nr:hypothetical protein NQ317_004278 [Molorchus minor]